jgi:hypothetical protein
MPATSGVTYQFNGCDHDRLRVAHLIPPSRRGAPTIGASGGGVVIVLSRQHRRRG